VDCNERIQTDAKRCPFSPCGPTVLREPRPPLIEVSEPCLSTLGRTTWTGERGILKDFSSNSNDIYITLKLFY
jgi:hypothetical protein